MKTRIVIELEIDDEDMPAWEWFSTHHDSCEADGFYFLGQGDYNEERRCSVLGILYRARELFRDPAKPDEPPETRSLRELYPPDLKETFKPGALTRMLKMTKRF